MGEWIWEQNTGNGWKTGKSGGKGNCNWDVMYRRKIKKQTSHYEQLDISSCFILL